MTFANAARPNPPAGPNADERWRTPGGRSGDSARTRTAGPRGTPRTDGAWRRDRVGARAVLERMVVPDGGELAAERAAARPRPPFVHPGHRDARSRRRAQSIRPRARPRPCRRRQQRHSIPPCAGRRVPLGACAGATAISLGRCSSRPRRVRVVAAHFGPQTGPRAGCTLVVTRDDGRGGAHDPRHHRSGRDHAPQPHRRRRGQPPPRHRR